MRAIAGAIIVLAGAVMFATASIASDAAGPSFAGIAYTLIGLWMIVRDYTYAGRSDD